MPIEKWEDIEDFKGWYQAGNMGNIRSLDRVITRKDGKVKKFKGRVLKQDIGTNGYPYVSLSVNGKTTKYSSHRLIAFAFLSESNLKLEVNHKDGVKTNNVISNLELITRSENQKHAYRTGLKKAPALMLGKFGKENHLSKKVIQYSLDGIMVNIFHSTKEAQRNTGVYSSNISSCCRNDRYKTAGGYKWKYVN